MFGMDCLGQSFIKHFLNTKSLTISTMFYLLNGVCGLSHVGVDEFYTNTDKNSRDCLEAKKTLSPYPNVLYLTFAIHSSTLNDLAPRACRDSPIDPSCRRCATASTSRSKYSATVRRNIIDQACIVG